MDWSLGGAGQTKQSMEKLDGRAWNSLKQIPSAIPVPRVKQGARSQAYINIHKPSHNQSNYQHRPNPRCRHNCCTLFSAVPRDLPWSMGRSEHLGFMCAFTPAFHLWFCAWFGYFVCGCLEAGKDKTQTRRESPSWLWSVKFKEVKQKGQYEEQKIQLPFQKPRQPSCKEEPFWERRRVARPSSLFGSSREIKWSKMLGVQLTYTYITSNHLCKLQYSELNWFLSRVGLSR